MYLPDVLVLEVVQRYIFIGSSHLVNLPFLLPQVDVDVLNIFKDAHDIYIVRPHMVEKVFHGVEFHHHVILLFLFGSC